MVITGKKQSTAQGVHEQRSVTKPSLFEQMKWTVMRGILSTVGRTSKGIRIGYKFGFDSGTMLDYVYVNQAQGNFGIGKLIDHLYLNAIGWQAIRARRALLKQMLHSEIERNRAQGKVTRL